MDSCCKPAEIPMSRSAQCRSEANGSCTSTDRTQKNKHLQSCTGMWEFELQSFQHWVVSCRQQSDDVTGSSGLSSERQADRRSGRAHWEPENRWARSSEGKRGCLGFQLDPPRCVWMFPAGKKCSVMLLCFPFCPFSCAVFDWIEVANIFWSASYIGVMPTVSCLDYSSHVHYSIRSALNAHHDHRWIHSVLWSPAYTWTQIRDVVCGVWTHYAASARHNGTYLYKCVCTYKLCLNEGLFNERYSVSIETIWDVWVW